MIGALVSVDHREAPLQSVFDNLRDISRLNLVVDWAGLNDIGIERETAVEQLQVFATQTLGAEAWSEETAMAVFSNLRVVRQAAERHAERDRSPTELRAAMLRRAQTRRASAPTSG